MLPSGFEQTSLVKKDEGEGLVSLVSSPTPTQRCVDQVEVKVFFDPSQFPVLANRFHLHDQANFKRFSCFFDTQTLHLFRAGVILRIRLHRDAKDSLTLKLRNFDSRLIHPEFYTQSRFRLKINRTGAHQTQIAKVETRTSNGRLKRVVQGKKKIQQALNPVQKQLFRQYMGSVELLDQLTLYRMVEAEIWKWSDQTFPYRLTLERWFLPSQKPLLELSIKVAPPKAEVAQRRLHQWLERQGIMYDLSRYSKTAICLTTQNQTIS
ncbi:hypothetical protein [Lyngbya sp. PCC 8106]|uniref:hypothetical protein n=1 Tax=Lyngbya sp. (strain PCC 8106) TaxID=313612 RepID=UPI0000EAAAC4|nr:hypothetical protein [Lyngbya sp. PCC 8106]EAW34613.1 hypothetical protein L8106_21859 [Lyngbya sp. PCC 8106]